MKYLYSHKKRVICFRRWSRKAYAAFQSLGKLVVIGHVDKSIVEASLRKSGKPEQIRYNPFNQFIIPEEELPPDEDELLFSFVLSETYTTFTLMQKREWICYVRFHIIALPCNEVHQKNSRSFDAPHLFI